MATNFGIIEAKEEYNFYKGSIANRKGEYQKAVKYLEDINYHSEAEKLPFYREILRAEAGVGNYKEAHNYSNRVISLIDSMYSDEMKSSIAFMKYEHENELLKDKAEKDSLRAERNEIKVQNSRLQSYSVAIISLLITLFAIILFKRYNTQRKLNSELKQKNRQISNMNVLIEKTSEEKLKFQKENYQEKLKAKNKEFQSMTVELLEKNNAIENLKESLQKECSSTPEVRAVIASSLSQHLRLEKLNDNFNKRFEMMNNDFQETLLNKYPDLSVSELKICSMLKSGLNTNEIASLLHLSNRTVENHRTNTRKKIGLQRSDDLVKILLAFDKQEI